MLVDNGSTLHGHYSDTLPGRRLTGAGGLYGGRWYASVKMPGACQQGSVTLRYIRASPRYPDSRDTLNYQRKPRAVSLGNPWLPGFQN